MSQQHYRYPFLRLKDVNEPYLADMEAAMHRVVESGRYIGGTELERFEQKLAAMCEAPYAVGVTNGLDALRLMMRAHQELNRLNRGDRVIVPANTYVATILAVTDMGLEPVFVEPDPRTLNLDTRILQKHMTDGVKAVMTVHLYGRTCYDEALAGFVKDNGLVLLEDNAQAIGAKAAIPGLFGSSHTGALGHAGAFSFYPTKNIGAPGDAGAVVTHDTELAECIRALRNYGSDRQYHNIYRGYNCRLDPMKAAALAVKLPHTDAENGLRRDRAAVYETEIDNPAVTKPLWVPDDRCVWHQYVVQVDDRDHFRDFLAAEGVETAVHYAVPPHRQPCYREYSDLHLPVTQHIADTVVSLPITRTTSLDDARAISAIINNYRP